MGYTLCMTLSPPAVIPCRCRSYVERTLRLQSPRTRNLVIGTTHISNQSENWLFQTLFLFGDPTKSTVKTLDMPSLPNRPIKPYSTPDRKTEGPCRYCRYLEHTEWDDIVILTAAYSLSVRLLVSLQGPAWRPILFSQQETRFGRESFGWPPYLPVFE